MIKIKTINHSDPTIKSVLVEVDFQSKEQLQLQPGLDGLKSGRRKQRGGTMMIVKRGKRGG
jgi:hypothetical protein